MEEDVYRTLARESEAVLREKGSKFLAYAYPVRDEGRIKSLLDELRKKYYDATHHCYAWRLGPAGERTRANDDGEPSGSAGKPILGQLLSNGITDALVVVVRYFGGTKLGVPGLIGAYREAAALAIEEAGTEERTVNTIIKIRFPYISMNGVMKAIKVSEPEIISQNFDNVCEIELSIRKAKSDLLLSRLKNAEGVDVDITE